MPGAGAVREPVSSRPGRTRRVRGRNGLKFSAAGGQAPQAATPGLEPVCLLAVQPDPQRTDRIEAMADGGCQVLALLVADHRQGGEQPVHGVQYDRPRRVRTAVQREDVGDSDHLVTAARHRCGDHSAVGGLSSEHEVSWVVE